MDVFSRLMMDRIIFLGTDVNDYTANVIQAQLLYLDSLPTRQGCVNLHQLARWLGICRSRHLRHHAVYFVGCHHYLHRHLRLYGCRASCSRRERQALRTAPFAVMIHQPMGGAQGQATDMEITVREIKKLKQELYHIISEHSGQPFEKVERDSGRDYWMTAEEALEYGMIDRVLVKANK